jgi:hypothetical protein
MRSSISAIINKFKQYLIHSFYHRKEQIQMIAKSAASRNNSTQNPKCNFPHSNRVAMAFNKISLINHKIAHGKDVWKSKLLEPELIVKEDFRARRY